MIEGKFGGGSEPLPYKADHVGIGLEPISINGIIMNQRR